MSDWHKPLLRYNTISAAVVSQNSFQGSYKKVLCICSAGILRSPTAAVVLSQEPFNFNTRSAGLDNCALIPVTEVLLLWADEIVCMTEDHYHRLRKLPVKSSVMQNLPIICLNIPDAFEYRDKQLQELIAANYTRYRDAQVHEEKGLLWPGDEG